MNGHTYIIIEGLALHGRHGVAPAERIVGNDFTFDIRLNFDAEAAMRTDDVSDTVSYAEVIDIIRRENDIPSRLLEHLAGRIRAAITARWPRISSGRIAVYKPKPPVSAELSRAGFVLEW